MILSNNISSEPPNLKLFQFLKWWVHKKNYISKNRYNIECWYIGLPLVVICLLRVGYENEMYTGETY